MAKSSVGTQKPVMFQTSAVETDPDSKEPSGRWPIEFSPTFVRALWTTILLAGLCLAPSGCVAPIGADVTTPARAYRQNHDNPVSHSRPSRDTRVTLDRFEQSECFAKTPDETLRLVQEKALATKERGLLFALAELNYLAGERQRHRVKPWEAREPRDYYLASAVYAWWFLFGEAADPPPGAFDERFRLACDLYNYGLGWALMERRSTNAVAELVGGTRTLPSGTIEVKVERPGFPWPLSDFDRFVVADHLTVRGLSVRNRQPGLGAPLVAVTGSGGQSKRPRTLAATALLRVEGSPADLAQGSIRATLELYSVFYQRTVRVGDREVPLEAETTAALAYALNRSSVWKLGFSQFFSTVEQVPTDIYLTQPYRPGRVPVVFVHGTFSSPVWWAPMFNTLAADPDLRQRYQFWYFIYNSGNIMAESAARLRESLQAKVRELDPEGQDAALRQMVVIGHSQGGLLTKLTATDTGEQLLQGLVKTNRLGEFKVSPERQAALRRLTVFEALPFVKRVVFISTPHRGSYAAGGVVRSLSRKLVTLPSRLVQQAAEITGLQEKLEFPKELRGLRTSLDSMSPRNPLLRALADIPLAPGVKGHSIIAVQGAGDFHFGRDGLVSYDSAHLDYVESEHIVRSFHSCQDKPPTIEEVRRILHEHSRTLPADTAN